MSPCSFLSLPHNLFICCTSPLQNQACKKPTGPQSPPDPPGSVGVSHTSTPHRHCYCSCDVMGPSGVLREGAVTTSYEHNNEQSRIGIIYRCPACHRVRQVCAVGRTVMHIIHLYLRQCSGHNAKARSI